MKNIASYFQDVYFLFGEDRNALPLIILMFIIVSVLDVVGVGLVGATITLFLSPGSDSSLSLTPWLEQITQNSQGRRLLMAVLLLGAFSVKCLVSILVNRVVYRYTEKMLVHLRTRTVAMYQKASYTDHLNRNSATYIRAALSYANTFTGSIELLLLYISEIIVMVALILFLSTMDWVTTIILAMFLGIIFVSYDWYFRKRLRDEGGRQNALAKEITMVVQETFRGFREIRIYHAETFFLDRLEKISGKLAQINVFSKTVGIIPRYLFELTIVLCLVMILVLYMLRGWPLESSLPLIAMFGAAAMRLGPSVTGLAVGQSRLRLNAPAIQDLACAIRKDEPRRQKESGDTLGLPFNDLRLENIYFRYPKVEVFSLENISLEVKRGESIGIIGPSGSGKTTLIDVILGLLSPESGNIVLNEDFEQNNLRSRPLRVAYLPQDGLILDDSLLRNVAFGVIDSEIDVGRVTNALKGAQLWNLIEDGSIQLDTLLGEGGTRLSGGQKQRVAIARAYYHDRDILVFDEATSALDLATEKEVLEELRLQKGRKTLIIVAHRLSTLRDCDRIYKLEKGRVIAVGDYPKMILTDKQNHPEIA